MSELQLHKDKHQFYLKRGGRRMAFIDYRMENNDTLVIEHTEVKPDFRGEGLGKELVNKVVEFTQQQGWDLKSECGYAAGIIEKYHLSSNGS